MKRYRGGVACLAAAVALFGLATAQAGELRQIKMITSLPTLTVAIPYTMVTRKYDQAHGLDVELREAGGSSSLQIDAVLSGDAEFATPGAPTALQAIRGGADLKIIAAIANNQITAVISNAALKKAGVSPTAPIGDRIKALKGMTIGTNPVGATYYQILRSYLKEYGVDPDNDVRLVGIAESSALISGLQQGRFDAIVSASGVVEQAISVKAGQMWFSGARGDIPGSEKSMVCVIVARSDTLEKHKDDVDRLLAALKDSLQAVQDDHAETGRLLKEQHFQKMDPAVWDYIWSGATAAYPKSLAFTKQTFDFWVANDPKGPDSFSKVDYQNVTYGPSQAQ